MHLVNFGDYEPTVYEFDLDEMRAVFEEGRQRELEYSEDEEFEFNEEGTLIPLQYAVIGPDDTEFLSLKGLDLQTATVY